MPATDTEIEMVLNASGQCHSCAAKKCGNPVIIGSTIILTTRNNSVMCMRTFGISYDMLWPSQNYKEIHIWIFGGLLLGILPSYQPSIPGSHWLVHGVYPLGWQNFAEFGWPLVAPDAPRSTCRCRRLPALKDPWHGTTKVAMGGANLMPVINFRSTMVGRACARDHWLNRHGATPHTKKHGWSFTFEELD